MTHADGPGPASWPERLVPWLVLIPIAFVTAFHEPFDERFLDLFHEGEYLAPRLFFHGDGVRPLLIHGYINYLPALAAEQLCDGDRLIGCTRAVNAAAVFIAELLFVGCALALARTRKALLFAGTSVAVILLALNGRIADTSPSVRDVALMGVVLCLLAGERSTRGWRHGLAGAAGLLAGLTIFWTYNRGLMGVIAIGAYVVATLVARRDMRGALVPAVTLAIGLAIVRRVDGAMWAQHLSNIAYWSHNGDIWRMRSMRQTVLNLPFFLSIAAVLAFAAWRAFECWRDPRRRPDLPILAVLAAILALVTQQCRNRDDPTHLAWIVPWLVLLGLRLLLPIAQEPASGWRDLGRRYRLTASVIAALLVLDFSTSAGFTRTMLQATLSNLRLVATRMPRDRDITPAATLMVSDALRAADPACTYAFDNGGGLYHLAGLRPCSSTMYPVYASRTQQAQVIAELEAARPKAVVGLSTDWFASIDDKTLQQRTPLLAVWLLRNYPIVHRIGGFDVRYRSAP